VKPTVLLIDTVHPALVNGLAQLGLEPVEAHTWTKDQVIEALPSATGLVIRSRIPIDAHFLNHGPQLQFIARVGAGMENIDIVHAEQLGIRCFSAPEGNRHAVGEHALGQLLMLMNHLHRADAEVRQGLWRRAENRGTELAGKTLGIIGYGHMGSAFAEKCRGLGMTILAYDKYKQGYAPAFVQESTLEQLCERADVISLHLPLTEETRGWAHLGLWKRFQKSPVLINTSRGAIVPLADLETALDLGYLRGACLDVLEVEPKSFEGLFEQTLPEHMQRLLTRTDVVFSPHIAGWTHESSETMAQVLVEKLGQAWPEGF
jgi:D-3-phosphoglycerate dehydrogenase